MKKQMQGFNQNKLYGKQTTMYQFLKLILVKPCKLQLSNYY